MSHRVDADLEVRNSLDLNSAVILLQLSHSAPRILLDPCVSAASSGGGEHPTYSVLKVSYFIQKRGWHENESDGTRHKQRRARYKSTE